MYLVELRPGKEELYRSSDELALAIRNGEVDARSRVYHRATAKWISITLHPQYKAIVAAAKEEPRPARRGWNILGGSSEHPGQSPEASSGSNGANLLHRWRRPLALGISAVLFMSGVQMAFSGPRPPWSGRAPSIASAGSRSGGDKARESARPVRSAPAAAQQEFVSSLPTLVSLASNNTTWIAAEPAPSSKTTRAIPKAPPLRSNLLRDALTPKAVKTANQNSLESLLARYEAARDSARSRLQGGLRVARLNQLFASSRLTPNGGVTDTRMSLAGAANFIRVYRQQQATIERAYQDTVTALAKQQAWSPKKVRTWYALTEKKESPTLDLISGSLFASIDSVFGVLDQEAGAYKLRGTAIAFEDPAASQTYGDLRRRIKEQIDAAIAAGGAISPGPAGLLLQAIGTSSLPRET
jgi:hypothetical protein